MSQSKYSDSYNRILVIQDEREQIIALSDFNLTLPNVGIFDEPTRCYKVNKEWAKIITGAISILLEIGVWKDAENDGYSGIQQISDFLDGEDCMTCEEIEACLAASQIITTIQSNVSNNLTDINLNSGDIVDNEITSSDNADDIQDLQDNPTGNTYNPTTPIAQTDIACQVSGHLAEQIGVYISTIDGYSTQPTLIDALEAIVLGAFSHDFSPLAQILDDLINGVILPLYNDYQIQQTSVHEQIYCNNDFSKDNLATWAVANLTRGQEISDMLNSIALNTWQQWQLFGEYASGYDCAALCPPEVWCYRFDFSLGVQGWSIMRGTIAAGGLKNVTHAEGNGYVSESEIQMISLPPNTTQIRVVSDWITTAFNSSAWANVIASQGGGTGVHIETVNAGFVGNGLTRDVTMNASDWVGAYVRFQSGANNGAPISGSPESYIRFIELSGTGPNPFGSNNC